MWFVEAAGGGGLHDIDKEIGLEQEVVLAVSGKEGEVKMDGIVNKFETDRGMKEELTWALHFWSLKRVGKAAEWRFLKEYVNS